MRVLADYDARRADNEIARAHRCAEALRALLASEPAPPPGAEPAAPGVREAFVAGAAWREYDEHGATIWTSDRRRAEEEAERRYTTAEWIESPRLTAAEGRVRELETLLRECNAVCLCGCPDSEHEADDCGESCGNDRHECIRVAPAVLAYVNKLRSARALPPEVEEAAEDVVRGDWWGHYCPSCGSTFKHGPECRIGRLAKALSSARGAKGGGA